MRQYAVAGAIALGGAVLLAGVAVLVVELTAAPAHGDRPFVRSVWLAHDSVFDRVRGEMSRDLSDRRLERGMTPAQVRHLLGPPDMFGNPIRYTLGPAPHFAGGELDLVFLHGRLVRALRRTSLTP